MKRGGRWPPAGSLALSSFPGSLTDVLAVRSRSSGGSRTRRSIRTSGEGGSRLLTAECDGLARETENMNGNETVIHSDPEIMGGTPVFVGTRVPLASLLDYLEAGQPLSEFLEDFPTVTREQAVAALEQAKEALLARARPT
jgi:uncharacterized protein (DUF433 family)